MWLRPRSESPTQSRRVTSPVRGLTFAYADQPDTWCYAESTSTSALGARSRWSVQAEQASRRSSTCSSGCAARSTAKSLPGDLVFSPICRRGSERWPWCRRMSCSSTRRSGPTSPSTRRSTTSGSRKLRAGSAQRPRCEACRRGWTPRSVSAAFDCPEGDANASALPVRSTAGPAMLVLDEATSALDNETERRLTDTIESLRGTMTMVIVAHRLSTVRHCDQLIFMSQGTGSHSRHLRRSSRGERRVRAPGGARPTGPRGTD